MKNKRTYEVEASIKDDILELVWTGDISENDSHQTMMNEIIDIEKSANV